MNFEAKSEGAPLRIVVVGGGFTGATFVIHAVRTAERPLDITVIEPLAELGRGVAYSAEDPAHRINVPSDRMALSKDAFGEATRWFFERAILPDADSHDGEGNFYVPRQAYGAFVANTLRDTLAGAKGLTRFKHLRARASQISRDGAFWRVTTSDRNQVEADVVALCFGHAAPAAPCPIGEDVARSMKFVPDPWAKQAFSKIGLTDSILIVGAGLTMADVVMSLNRAGCSGPVTAISRRGLLPGKHGLFLTDVDLFQGAPPPKTALGVLRLLRRRIRESAPSIGWQPFVDTLRYQLPIVWGGFPIAEKQLVLRRLLPFWDVHRFRIAPQASATLERWRETGRLSLEKAGLVALSYREGQFAATLRGAGGRRQTRIFDAVVLCTGPDKNLKANPLIASLLTDGTARLDDIGLGLAVDSTSRVIDAEGRPCPTLLAFGPMTRGSFGEMTGAPDIARHVERVAPYLLESIKTP